MEPDEKKTLDEEAKKIWRLGFAQDLIGSLLLSAVIWSLSLLINDNKQTSISLWAAIVFVQARTVRRHNLLSEHVDLMNDKIIKILNKMGKR